MITQKRFLIRSLCYAAALSIILSVSRPCSVSVMATGPGSRDTDPSCEETHFVSSQEDLQEDETEDEYEAEGVTGPVRWSLSGNVLTLSGCGRMPDYASGKAPWYPYRTSVKAVVIRSGITYIGSYAFKHVPMYAASIPSTVTGFGYKAFAYTDRLRSVYFSGDEKKWAGIDIGFGNSAVRTSRVLFEKAASTAATKAAKKGLSSRTIKRSLRWSLSGTTLTISGNGSMQNYAADLASAAPWHSLRGRITKIVITQGVKSVGNYAFYDFSRLKVIQLAPSVKRIGARAFYRCNGLKAVALPDSVSMICRSAFQRCGSLEAVVLPRSIKAISSYCFSQCGSLRVIVIPAGVKKIEANAFWSCESLSKINFRGSLLLWKALEISTGNRPARKAVKVYGYCI